MLQADQVEELICVISALDRDALVGQFENYHASFPVDFTTDFLKTQSLERLRHLFLAVCLQSKRLPMVNAPTAA